MLQRGEGDGVDVPRGRVKPIRTFLKQLRFIHNMSYKLFISTYIHTYLLYNV